MADLFSEKAADADESKSAEGVSSERTEVIRSDTGKLPRPLSQFILAKQYETISAGIEPPRSAESLCASVRPPQKKTPSAPSVHRHAPLCRVEYPLYDGDLSEDNLSDEPNMPPRQIFPELSVLTSPLSEPVLRTETPPIPLLLPQTPSVCLRTISDDERGLPLPCDSFRTFSYPIFERYLAVCSREGG